MSDLQAVAREVLADLQGERDERGRFVVGNPGGPGRPARAVELTYLRGLSDELTLDDWRAVVRKAIEQAKAGDAQARAWVTRYALGQEPPPLWSLAIRETLGVSEEHELAADARREAGGWGPGSSALEDAAIAADSERQAEERRRKREERKARQLQAERAAQGASAGESA